MLSVRGAADKSPDKVANHELTDTLRELSRS